MSTHTARLIESSIRWPEVSAERDSATSFSLSVLVPVYNEHFLVETSLRRLLALTDKLIRHPEVIVVN